MMTLIGITAPLADAWGMHDSGVGAGWWAIMMIGTFALWASVVIGFVWLVRGGLNRSDRAAPSPDAPLETLNRRLASGEISPEEYSETRRLLGADR